MKKMFAVGSVAMLSAFCILPASAQIYMCKDASGRTLTSDRPIPECSNREMREMGKDGVTRRVIAAPLTAEEKRKRTQEEEKKKAEATALEEQRKSDRALMARFSSEKTIEDARRRALEIAEDAIKREKVSMDATEKQLAQFQKDAEGYTKRKAKVPANLQGKIDDATRAIEDSNKQIKERQDELVEINAKFDVYLKRYREIQTASAK
jgi:hypothetical protein